METLAQLRNELQQEYEITERFLERFPAGQNNFSPHERSMKLMDLASHLAEVFGWPAFVLETEMLDFSSDREPSETLESRDQLIQRFKKGYVKSIEQLNGISEADLEGRWKMAMGEKVLADWSKYEAIRHALNQIVHHRAQLGVYYRLLGIPVPASLGPTADELGMMEQN